MVPESFPGTESRTHETTARDPSDARGERSRVKKRNHTDRPSSCAAGWFYAERFKAGTAPHVEGISNRHRGKNRTSLDMGWDGVYGVSVTIVMPMGTAAKRTRRCGNWGELVVDMGEILTLAREEAARVGR